MNYILTMRELKSLLVLLGAKELFRLQNQERQLSREDVVECVASLTQRGILTPEEDCFRCNPEVKTLVKRIIAPQKTMLLTRYGTSLPQICGYGADGQYTLVEEIPFREGEYRLLQRSPEEMKEALVEDGYLPQETPEEEKMKKNEPVLVPEFLHSEQVMLILENEKKGLQLWVDFYDGKTHQIQSRSLVYLQHGKLRLAIAENGTDSVGVYQQKTFLEWLCRMMRRKKDDIG